jgi:hypothetical protein
VCRIVPFRPWDSGGGSRRDPYLWGFCGAAQAPAADLREPVGAGLASQQADTVRAEHHYRDRGHGTVFIARDACARSAFVGLWTVARKLSLFRTCLAAEVGDLRFPWQVEAARYEPGAPTREGRCRQPTTAVRAVLMITSVSECRSDTSGQYYRASDLLIFTARSPAGPQRFPAFTPLIRPP